jgi:ATP-dependent Lon protease
MNTSYTTPWTFDELPCYRSETVLMPSTRLVYHLTDERRQCTMRRAALDDGLLAVRRDPDDGDPVSIATLAEIDRIERLSPTRITVALRGLARLRVEGSSTTDLGIELLEGEVLSETNADSPGADALVADARADLARLSDRGYEIVDDIDASLDGVERTNAVPDVLGAFIFDEPAEHQSLLEETDVVERLRRVESRLNELIERADTLSP